MPYRRSATAVELERWRNELERWRGDTDARLESLIRSFNDEREDARKHRQSLRDVIGALSVSVGNLAESVREIKPIVEDYREKRAEARGAAKLGKLLWAGLVAIGAMVGALVTEIMKRIGGYP